MSDEILLKLSAQMEDLIAYTKNAARDLQSLKSMVTEVVMYMKEAESEVPEKMRRFIMYYHDTHDLVTLYHTTGIEPPAYVRREIERCDDRLRHLLEELHGPGGAFEKVRQEMSTKEGNRYDFSRMLEVKR